jgi:hypothetical protein
MTTTGHLDLGAAKIINSATGELIGYAYTEATPTGQLQRWLLYRDPNNSFKVQAPPTHMTGWSLSDWKANVPSLWKPNAFYVRAQADVYRHGHTYGGVQWTRIPRASQLPDPSYPEGAGDSHQLDPLGKVIRVRQEDIQGLAYTVNGLLDPSSAEYWMLPASYQPAGARSAVGISPGSEVVSSLDDFITLANESFLPGSVFVITGCSNYNGTAVPAML